jgi:hypothetical protein
VAFIASTTILTVLCIKPRSKPEKSSPAAGNVEETLALSWLADYAMRKYCRSAKVRFSSNAENWRKASQLEIRPRLALPQHHPGQVIRTDRFE